MAVIGIDHVNIRTPDVAATLGFFRDVLEMTVTPPPGRSSISDSGWVLAGNGHAAIHVGSTSLAFPGDDKQAAVASRGSGAGPHVALNCADFAAAPARSPEKSCEGKGWVRTGGALVTGVQTCALPIWMSPQPSVFSGMCWR